MSMISEQVKELRIAEETCKQMGREGIAKFLRQAADTIEALSAKLAAENMGRSDRYYGGGWIACEDRLPEWGTNSFLVCLKNGGIFLALYLPSGEFKEISSMGTREFCENNPVVAWQPLPEPYRP